MCFRRSKRETDKSDPGPAPRPLTAKESRNSWEDGRAEVSTARLRSMDLIDELGKRENRPKGMYIGPIVPFSAYIGS